MRVVFLCLALVLSIDVRSEDKQHSSPESGGGHAFGSAAQFQSTCSIEMECQEILIRDTEKIKEGTGVDVEIPITFKYQKARSKYVPPEYVRGLPKGTVLRSFSRPFTAVAFDLEGTNPQAVEKAAMSRLERATSAISNAKEEELGFFVRSNPSTRLNEHSRLSCKPKEGAKPKCESSQQSRLQTLNRMLEPQYWTGDVSPMLTASGVAEAGRKKDRLRIDANTRTEDLPVTADPFHIGDTLLFREALQAKERFPVPDRLYCYYIVEKTRPFLEGEVHQASSQYYGMSTSRHDGRFLFLMSRATSHTTFAHTSSSQLSVHLSTQYKGSGALVLEDVTEKGSYKDALEMKQDSCNRAQERYLVANTFSDVIVGCHCSSQRILPNGRVSEFKTFEY